jgi:hypothetical protein
METTRVIKNQNDLIEGNNGQFEGTIFYEQGDEAAKVLFMLVCHEIPKGSTVSFNCPESGPQPPINLPPTQVTLYPTFTVGVRSDVPAGFSGTITYKVEWNQPPPPGASVTFQIAYVAGE